MRILTFLFLLLIVTSSSFGQTKDWTEEQFESALIELKNNGRRKNLDATILQLNSILTNGIENYPSQHLDYIGFLAELYHNKGELENSNKYTQQIKELVNHYGLHEEIWKYYIYAAMLERMKGNHHGTIKYYKSVIGSLDTVKPRDEEQRKRFASIKGGQMSNMSTSYRILGQNDSAKIMLHNSIDLSDSLDLKFITIKSLDKLGHLYYDENDYVKAVSNYLTSYNYSIDNKNLRGETLSKTYIARVYTVLGQYEKSLKLYDEIIENAKALSFNKALPTTYLQKAEILLWMDRYEAAQEMLDLNSSDTTTAKTKELICYQKLIQASLDLKLNNNKRAIDVFRNILTSCAQFLNKGEETIELYDAYLGIATYHFKQGAYKPALDTIEIALNTNIRLKSSIELLDLKSSIHKKQGNYKLALDSNDDMNVLKDSMLSLNKIGIFITEQANSQSAQKQLEIEKLEAENNLISVKDQQKRNIIYGLIGSLFLLGGMGWFYSRHRKIKLEKELADVKQHLLRQQINPHFIFNTLNSIQSSILVNDQEKTLSLFNRFSNLMRQVLENSTDAFIPLDEELRLLENYLALEKVRTNQKFDYKIEVAESVDTSFEKVPSMVLQIFLENSIWHGIIPKEENGLIQIKVSKEKDCLKIKIEDDGVGLSYSNKVVKSENHKKKSLGTKLVKQRLHLLNRKFGKNIQVNILQVQNGPGTLVEMSI